MKNPFNFNGCQFASFTYTNSYGEVSTYKVLLGASYENARLKDIETLQNTSFPQQKLEFARLSIVNSMLKNMNNKTRSNQSQAQKDAYISLGKGLRIHKDSGEVKVMAYVQTKSQTPNQQSETLKNQQSGLFKTRKFVNSSQATLDKKQVKKMLELRETKIVQFTFTKERLERAKINGVTIEF